MKIKIESGIPIPKSKADQYRLNDMEVGDSITIPMELAPDIRVTVGGINLRGEKHFITRSINQKNIRVWRTK